MGQSRVINQARTKGKVATKYQSRDKDVDGEVARAKVTAWDRAEAEAAAQRRAAIASQSGPEPKL